MPELAEVEFYRKRCLPALHQTVLRVHLNPDARVFRQIPHPQILSAALPGQQLLAAEAHGKQLRFRFSNHLHLGIHLGMTGQLRLHPEPVPTQNPEPVPTKSDFQETCPQDFQETCPHTEPVPYIPDRHDHLVLFLHPQPPRKSGFSSNATSTSTIPTALILNDPRMFGCLRWFQGPGDPPWWSDLPPQPHEPAFSRPYFLQCLQHHPRAPLKAFLLNQDRCPGIGNWMADEICFRVRLHPAERLQNLSLALRQELWRSTRKVARDALRVIGTDWSTPPPSWLFNHRWRKGGTCPRDGSPLIRDSVAGRTTAFCPLCQPPLPEIG